MKNLFIFILFSIILLSSLSSCSEMSASSLDAHETNYNTQDSLEQLADESTLVSVPADSSLYLRLPNGDKRDVIWVKSTKDFTPDLEISTTREYISVYGKVNVIYTFNNVFVQKKE